MYPEARKIHLIEEVLKVENEDVLLALENVLKSAGLVITSRRPSAHEFSGSWSREDAALIEKAIEDGCEEIHPDDWK